MSQILDAIDKAETLRKRREATQIHKQEALAHVIGNESSQQNTSRSFILIALLFLIGITSLAATLFLFFQNESKRDSYGEENKNNISLTTIHSTKTLEVNDQLVGSEALNLNAGNDATKAHIGSAILLKNAVNSQANPSLKTYPAKSDLSKGNKSAIPVDQLKEGSTLNAMNDLVTKNALDKFSEVKTVSAIDLPVSMKNSEIDVDLPTPDKRILQKMTPSVSRETRRTQSSMDEKKTELLKNSTRKKRGKTNKSDNKVQAKQISINVLMYDDDPVKSVVVINGHSVKIGDLIHGTNYTLSSIRRDGVIIESTDGPTFIKPFK